MNGFVTKPINPEALWQALLRWITLRPGLGLQAAPAVAAAADADPALDGLLQALTTLPDLDTRLGLLRTANNPAFYISLLKKFVASQVDAVQHINRSLEDGDRPSAERIAHTLKGVAGNLGATALQASAEALESSLRQAAATEQTLPLLADMAERLAHFIQALQTVPGLFPAAACANSSAPSAAERQAAEAVVQQLKNLLANDDASAMELWESHAPALRALLAQAADIEAAINGYDFEAAITLMEEST